MLIVNTPLVDDRTERSVLVILPEKTMPREFRVNVGKVTKLKGWHSLGFQEGLRAGSLQSVPEDKSGTCVC